MKKDILKYIFIIFVIIIIIYAIYKINDKEEIQEEAKVENKEEIVQDLKLGIAGYDTINPILSNNKYVQDISKLIYEPLITISSDYKIEMCLASEWARTSDTTYVIKLKENIKWSNGEEFTGEDVLYTMDRIKEMDSIYTPNVAKVIQIDVIDKYIIKITLSEEVPFFEYNLNFPIMSKSYCEGEDFQNSEKTKMPIGTGEYKISSISDNNINLQKNNIWWDKENKGSKIENIKINLYTTVGEMYNDFKLGKIDLIESSNINVEDYIGTIGYNKIEYSGREYNYLAINTSNEILSNKEVRQAIMYSINKNTIISDVYKNKYFIAEIPLSYGNWLYQGNNSNNYDINKAKQILQDNGWEYKYQYWQKNINYYTRKLNFKLIVNSSDTSKLQVAELIKTQLEEVGIKITIIKANDNQYQNYLKNKNYDIILCSTYSSINPDLSIYFGENNLAKYTQEEVTTILNEIKNITDEELLKQKYARLYEIFMEDVPYIGLYNSYNIVAYSKELSGNMTGNWYNIFYNINTWVKK